MALIFFDTSALVKLLLDEPGTPLVEELWDTGDSVLASRLAYPEVRSALAAAARNHDIDADCLDEAEKTWDEYWAAIRPVELTSTVAQHAGKLTRLHSLKGADAVHLASALAIDDPDLVIAVWDRRLHTAAQATGTPIAPATL